MIAFGIISTLNASTGRARVELQTDGIVTADLPILQRNDGYFTPISVNTPVAVLLDENAENGVVLGAIYDDNNQPPSEANEDSDIIKFEDGTLVEYDKSEGTYTIKVGQSVYTNKSEGHAIKKGTISLKTAVTDLITAIKAITVTCAAAGSPSSIPINILQFEAVQTQINQIFSE